MSRPDDGVGLKGEGQPAGGSGGSEGAQEGGREKLFSTVGNVPVYQGFYIWGAGVRAADYIQDVKHPKQPEWGVGVCATWAVTGNFRPWCLSGDECRGGDFCAGVEQVSSHSNGGANPAQWWRRGILPRGAAIIFGVALPPRPELCQLPDGERVAAV